MPRPYRGEPSDIARGTVPVSVVILAQDEDINISHALDSAAWAAQVIVVDSGSTDRTVEIARAAGAVVVETHWRGFGPQREFACRLPEIDHEWIYFLDADEWVSHELASAIAAAVLDGAHDAYWQYVRLVFQGRWIKHCGWYPSARLVRLLRRANAHYPEVGFSEHPSILGTVGPLGADIIDDDHKGLALWLHKHVRYAQLEAARRAENDKTPPRRRPHESHGRFFLKDVVAPRMPARPLATFVYMYVVRGGFLDGREGLLFCTLHGWFQLVVDSLGTGERPPVADPSTYAASSRRGAPT